MTRSIAICGFKGCGKDYAGKIISGRFNHLPVAFADPIKEVIINTYHLTGVEEYDAFKRMDHRIMGRDVSGRRIVRETGMAMRDVNNNFATEYVSSYQVPVVVTDLRFQNELSFCKMHNMVIVKILGGNSDDHVSEQGIDSDDCDIVIPNNFDSSFGETLITQLGRYIL
jgi:hypothetical protein